MKRCLTVILSALLCLSALTGVAESKKMEDYAPLHTLADDYGFLLGGAFSYSDLKNQTYLDFLARHFNSVTATNEMKAYSLLNQSISKLSKDGMPGMNYYQADKMVEWAHKNGLKVRGHVLVWDAYMTDWFFREGYDSKRPYADQETMRARLASYIDQVITHFEEKFPGTVYCWDVVNEAVGDNAREFVLGDARRLRTTRNNASNPFRDLVGDDYVEYSFLCAKNTVEKLGADIKLFYNDYSTFYFDKRMAISALVKSINSYAQDENGEYRKLIDGVGMQGYIGGYGTQNGCMNPSDLNNIRTTIQAFSALGVEVHITEMAVRNYDKNQAEKHAAYYGQLMNVFKGLSKEGQNPLTCVAIWGLLDCPQLPKNNYTYQLNSPYGGLLTEKYELKPVFDTVYQTLGGK